MVHDRVAQGIIEPLQSMSNLKERLSLFIVNDHGERDMYHKLEIRGILIEE